ncbi:MAG: dephospho-CoA kinase [Bacillota bacterium]|jgi:dephospho-CoA kinase
MVVIGLVGNIGSGKSLAAKYLEEKGAAIIDADKIARDIVMPHKPAWQKIVSAFGQAYLLPDKNINRRMLAEKIFSDQKSRELLNSITHPYLYEEAQKKILAWQKKGVSVIVLEAAILLESEFTDLVDEIWLVVAGKELLLSRLKNRDNLSQQEIEKRLSSQMLPQEQMKLADKIIYNEQSVNDLRQKIYDLYDECQKIYAKG